MSGFANYFQDNMKTNELRDSGKDIIRLIAVTVFIGLLILSFVQPVQQAEASGESEAATPAKPAVDAKPKTGRKLQIGIKKRPEKCDRKSKKGDLLHIHYRGYLEDGGTEFDNSYKRGTPLTFTLGHGQVIQGWDTGLMGVCENEKRKLVIPPELGYGTNGAPPTIPPNAFLIFEVECLKIEDKRSEL